MYLILKTILTIRHYLDFEDPNTDAWWSHVIGPDKYQTLHLVLILILKPTHFVVDCGIP